MQIRRVKLLALTVALLVVGMSASVAWPARADDAKLDGTWKLVVLAFGDDEFAILKLSTQEGKTAAAVVDAQQMVLGKAQVKQTEQKGDNLKFTLNGPNGDMSFEGKLAQDGPGAGKVLGVFHFRGEPFPARLEKTTDAKVAPFKQGPLIAKFIAAQGERDPKSKIKKLEELIQENHGAPSNHLLYSAALGAAEAAGLDALKVGDMIKQWSDQAKPYGDIWFQEVRLKALKAIGASKSFAKLTVALAQDADKTISEQAIEKKAEVVGLLAKSARLAGMADLAAEADARQAKLDLKLDEAYHQKVPPFKPTPFAGRKNPQANRVVLMELFTGAECPPCVAADVAFDAALQAYKSTDFIGLQYHLHIPGPDPLTNQDSVARQQYYADKVRGTPSTFFNGHSDAGGGGPMAASEGKFTEYRKIIDETLGSATKAQIDLSATRTGDQVSIVASARVPENGTKAKSSGDEKEQAKQFLRLALTESAVRYVGGNKLRFHHHVVRALPGGAKGKELVGGAGKVEVTLKIADLKRDLETYLSDFTKSAAFSHPLPDIKLDDLAVVAFIQDDGDQSVVHAASVPVKENRP
jgi:hypothetical protein